MLSFKMESFHIFEAKNGKFPHDYIMNFWENVVSELEYQNIERKRLANEVGFDVSNIGKGMKNGNVPLADTAVRIARFLGVSVEYLVSGSDSVGNLDARLQRELQLFQKYRPLLEKLDSLPEGLRLPLVELIEGIRL